MHWVNLGRQTFMYRYEVCFLGFVNGQFREKFYSLHGPSSGGVASSLLPFFELFTYEKLGPLRLNTGCQISKLDPHAHRNPGAWSMLCIDNIRK
jgi:hypothetical protein